MGGDLFGEAARGRDALLARWLELTRASLPGMAARHGWPIHLDHCFMRVCLDAALGAPWTATVARPASRHMTDAQLAAAVAVAEGVAAEPATLPGLNRASLEGRRAAKARRGGGRDHGERSGEGRRATEADMGRRSAGGPPSVDAAAAGVHTVRTSPASPRASVRERSPRLPAEPDTGYRSSGPPDEGMTTCPLIGPRGTRLEDS